MLRRARPGSRSSRWTFSISASSNACAVETSFTTTSASRSPAFWHARQRRSPAMISNLSAPAASRRTTIGSSSPCSRIDCGSSSSACVSKCCRGCPLCGTIFSSGAEEDVSVAVAGGRRRRRREERVEAASERAALRVRTTRAGWHRAWSSEELARERQVALGALRLHVVEDDGLAVRRRLARAARCAGSPSRTRGSDASLPRRPGARGCFARRTS